MENQSHGQGGYTCAMREDQTIPEAPGRLELVRRFVNSRDIEAGTDAFRTVAGLRDWLGVAGLLDSAVEVGEGDMAHAVEAREALRELLLANHTGSPAPAGSVAALNSALRRAGQSIAFSTVPAWVTEPAAGGVDGAIGRLLGVVIQAMADGTWPRLKACANDRCRWAFYDWSRPRSAKWCHMDLCGNRAKQRAWRSRQTARAAPNPRVVPGR